MPSGFRISGAPMRYRMNYAAQLNGKKTGGKGEGRLRNRKQTCSPPRPGSAGNCAVKNGSRNRVPDLAKLVFFFFVVSGEAVSNQRLVCNP